VKPAITVRALRRLAVIAVPLGACALLAACTGSLFQSKAAPPSVYLLSARLGASAAAAPSADGSPGAASPTMPADLAVLRPRIRKGLESDRIAVLYPDRRLDYYADARWSGPLDEVLQDLAVAAFHSGAHLRTVSADASAFASGYWLEIEVVDFQAEYTPAAAAPTVHVHLLARVGGAADRRILGSFEASALQPADDNRLTAIVGAYEQAVDASLVQIVADTERAIDAGLKNR
jgi:cholesterol transport system auxiliary component